MYFRFRKYYFLIILAFLTTPDIKGNVLSSESLQISSLTNQLTCFKISTSSIIASDYHERTFLYSNRQLTRNRKISSLSKVISVCKYKLFAVNLVHAFFNEHTGSKLIDRSNHSCFLI